MVLDEPTNHLDMRSKDILKQALIRYDGTLIVVSHDRDFLDGLVEKVYEFKHNKIKENIGGIYDFLRKKKIENLRDLEVKERVRGIPGNNNISSSKLRYIEKKEYDRNLRKLRKKLEETEREIEATEAEIAVMDKILMAPDHSSTTNEELYSKYQALRERLNAEINKWGDCNNEVEEFLRNSR
jgi:ATP-binding cassette subfamily F protein 3